MTNLEALQLGLFPGLADSLQQRAEGCGNMAWDGLFQGVIVARQAFYATTALSLICGVGACLASGKTRAVALAATSISGLLAVVAGGTLYQRVSVVQSIVNEMRL